MRDRCRSQRERLLWATPRASAPDRDVTGQVANGHKRKGNEAHTRTIGASVFLEDPTSRLAPECLAKVLADEGAQRRLVVRAQMPPAVHEERRRAQDAALIGALDVALDTQRVAPALKVVGEPVGVEAQLACVSGEIVEPERVLVLE